MSNETCRLVAPDPDDTTIEAKSDEAKPAEIDVAALIAQGHVAQAAILADLAA